MKRDIKEGINMIVAHIIMNIFFASFFVLDVLKIRKKQSNEKIYRFIIITMILGVLTYISYVTLLLNELTVYAFDKQTLSLLILGWTFMFSAYMILKKKNNYNNTSS